MIPAQIPRIVITDSFFRDIRVLETDIEILARRIDDFYLPLSIALSEIIIPSIKQNFAVQGRPPWAKLKPSTIRTRKTLGTPILVVTWKMYRAVTDPNNWTQTKDTIALVGISQKVRYAPYHQGGTRKMVARPFVEYQQQDIIDITELFEAWMGDVIDHEWGEKGEL